MFCWRPFEVVFSLPLCRVIGEWLTINRSNSYWQGKWSNISSLKANSPSTWEQISQPISTKKSHISTISETRPFIHLHPMWSNQLLSHADDLIRLCVLTELKARSSLSLFVPPSEWKPIAYKPPTEDVSVVPSSLVMMSSVDIRTQWE